MKLHSEREALEIFRDACAGVAFLALAFAAFKVTSFLDREEPQLVRTTIEAGAAMRNFELASRGLKAKEEEEFQDVKAISAQVKTIADNVNTAVLSLNTTLRTLNTLVADTDRNENTVMRNTSDTIKATKPILDNLNATLVELPPLMRHMDEVVGDPSIRTTSQHLAAASANLETMSQSGVLILDDARRTADWYWQKITSPVTFARRAGGAVSNFVARVIGSAL